MRRGGDASVATAWAEHTLGEHGVSAGVAHTVEAAGGVVPGAEVELELDAGAPVSPHEQAAVDVERRAGHEPRLLGGQEGD